jgi:hypothetical protein
VPISLQIEGIELCVPAPKKETKETYTQKQLARPYCGSALLLGRVEITGTEEGRQ